MGVMRVGEGHPDRPLGWDGNLDETCRFREGRGLGVLGGADSEEEKSSVQWGYGVALKRPIDRLAWLG